MEAIFREMKDWFRACADVIYKLDRTVEWETPLGLPVVQPYLDAELRPVAIKQVHRRGTRVFITPNICAVISSVFCRPHF